MHVILKLKYLSHNGRTTKYSSDETASEDFCVSTASFSRSPVSSDKKKQNFLDPQFLFLRFSNIAISDFHVPWGLQKIWLQIEIQSLLARFLVWGETQMVDKQESGEKETVKKQKGTGKTEKGKWKNRKRQVEKQKKELEKQKNWTKK